MLDIYYTYQYKYKVSRLFYVYFLSRTDKVANEMKELYELGIGKKIKLKKKRLVMIKTPPYPLEQEQIKKLKGGLNYGRFRN